LGTQDKTKLYLPNERLSKIISLKKFKTFKKYKIAKLASNKKEKKSKVARKTSTLIFGSLKHPLHCICTFMDKCSGWDCLCQHWRGIEKLASPYTWSKLN
jgi:hypothetical protein